MLRRWFVLIAAALLGLCFLPATAQAASPAADPTGCTTSVQWVTQGSNYFQGLGTLTCQTGTYKAKAVCMNEQTGVGYVNYGSQTVSAPATTTVMCNTGNVAQTVLPVTVPAGTGVTGCATWGEWVTQGSNLFFGRANVQCDTGSYKIKAVCHNDQTGADYLVEGTEVVTAPAKVSITCNTGNVESAIGAVAVPAGSGVTGCLTWTGWVTQGNNYFDGRGSAQCDTGIYHAVISCQNLQTGQTYTVNSPAVSAPEVATTTCYTGNVAQSVTVAAS
jgi:hypothetical protein